MVQRNNRDPEHYSHPPVDSFSIGIILSLQLSGINPVHPCATVFYPKSCNTWDIAESLIDVVYEIREDSDVFQCR